MRGYSLTVESDDNGTLLVSFVDIPEAHTLATDEEEGASNRRSCVRKLAFSSLVSSRIGFRLLRFLRVGQAELVAFMKPSGDSLMLGAPSRVGA